MEDEAVLFIMSMSDTMSFLMPPPVDMDLMDEFKDENNNSYKSRWAMCTDIIRQMIGKMEGCQIDVAIAKNSDLGLSVTRGNSDERREPLMNLLNAISTTLTSNGRANPEFAVREIDKFLNSDQNKTRKIHCHWFIDAETFLEFNPSSIDRNFKNLKMYVVGQIRTLHDRIETAKHFTATWQHKIGTDLKFMLCGADFDDLRAEISEEKRLEWREKTVKFVFGHKEFDVQLLQKAVFGSAECPLELISFVGILPEIELCRLNDFNEKRREMLDVSTKSEAGNEILYSLAQFLLGESKKSPSALCKCFGIKKLEEYAILTAQSDETNEMSLSLVRIPKHEIDKQFVLKMVDQTNEPSEPLPEISYTPIAPIDHKIIKRRLRQIGKEPLEVKRLKYEQLSQEYDLLDVKEAFLQFSSQWKLDHLEEPEI
ncbi:unnamed protein product [Caenorhabditis sp. 36 PRJEB53466]|nr:unnamed protein product [Caenorhabditis sp. 36 PRJEB53466]